MPAFSLSKTRENRTPDRGTARKSARIARSRKFDSGAWKKPRSNILPDSAAVIGKNLRVKQTEKYWAAICARRKPSDSAARSSFYRRVTGDGNDNGIRRFSRPTGLDSRRPCRPLHGPRPPPIVPRLASSGFSHLCANTERLRVTPASYTR